MLKHFKIDANKAAEELALHVIDAIKAGNKVRSAPCAHCTPVAVANDFNMFVSEGALSGLDMRVTAYPYNDRVEFSYGPALADE